MSAQTLPISTSQAQAASTLVLISSKLKDYGANILKQGKSWTEVADRTAFSKPNNAAEAISRIKKNSAYFRVNYLIIMLGVCIVTFLMHPSSLFVLGFLLGGWIYVMVVRQTPLTIGGRTLSEKEKLLGMSAVSFITIFFLTSVGTVLFTALSISMAVIVLHGVMRQPDDLFLDEVETNNGFLSVFTNLPTAPPPASNNV